MNDRCYNEAHKVFGRVGELEPVTALRGAAAVVPWVGPVSSALMQEALDTLWVLERLECREQTNHSVFVIQKPCRYLSIDNDGASQGGKVFAHLAHLGLTDLVVID